MGVVQGNHLVGNYFRYILVRVEVVYNQLVMGDDYGFWPVVGEGDLWVRCLFCEGGVGRVEVVDYYLVILWGCRLDGELPWTLFVLEVVPGGVLQVF